MNPIKRKLSSSRTFVEQFKRFQKNTCLEDLSNELFYELFDYLDGCEIYKAFTHLNNRFQNLLSDPSLMFRIDLSSTSKATLEHRCRDVIIPNRHRLRSLHLNDNSLINDFFIYCHVDSSFNRLASVVLNHISESSILVMLFYLKSLPRLSSLTILLEEDYYYNLSDIYRLIFHLPYLKYSKLWILDYVECEVFVPMSINEKPSTIERLVINFPCTLNQITSLLVHIPHLQYLTCERLFELDEDEIDRNKDRLALPRLTHISINDCAINFDKFEIFIKEISSQLQVFRLGTSWRLMYLDADRWEQLIKKHMPQLSEFHFVHHTPLDDMDASFEYHTAIHQFFSSFWIEKKWSFELKKEFYEIIFSIHRLRETWFNRHTDDQTMPYSTGSTNINILEHCTSPNPIILPIQLTLNDFGASSEVQFFIEQLKPYSITMSFTHLNISNQEIFNGLLLEMIRLLPNLHSIEIASMSGLQLDVLSREDLETLLLVSLANKIAKVKLHKMNKMEQIYFLMDLCPRMQYLQVGCGTENDLKEIVRFIIMNSIRHMHYLKCLCVCVPDANEKMVESLTIMIDLTRVLYVERIFTDYKIHRIQNKIFLEWKV